MVTNGKMTKLILSACLMLGASSFYLPAFSEDVVPPDQPLEIAGKKYEVMSEMPIVINRNAVCDRNAVCNPIMTVTTSSPDGRYQFIEFIEALTQDRQESQNSEAAQQLYRLAAVQDTNTGKRKIVALPIRFNPPIRYPAIEELIQQLRR